jgi:hypothetical protein
MSEPAFSVARTTCEDDWAEVIETAVPPELVSQAQRMPTGDSAETRILTKRLLHPRGTSVALPIPLEVRFGEGFVAVVETRTGIHGMGTTTSAAIADFWQALRDFDTALEAPLTANLRQLRRALDLFLAL